MNKGGPVKVVMIGLDWWGKKMTAVLQKAKGDIEIVCAAEPNPAGKEFAETNGFEHYCSETEALQHPGVEAIILATPHSLHAEQIKRAVAAGKHIFCEKPVALSRKEAAAAVGACSENNLVLGTGHERRWESPVARMLWIDIRDKAHVEAPAGWVVTSAMAGGPIAVTEVPPAEPVKDNLVAFARAVRGEAPYPITGEDLVNNISILKPSSYRLGATAKW